MTDNDYDKAIVWCKKKIENVKKHHILSGKRLEGYEEAMLCVMSYLHCKKERSVDMTNADRIRAMSNEEMCNWLFQRDCTNIAAFFEPGGMGVMNAVQLLDWLQQPAE